MLDDFKHKLDALSQMDFAEDLYEIVKANESELINMQRDQWSKGTDREGKSTKLDGNPNYTVFTINYKARHGQGLGEITDYVTGFMEGALYEHTFMNVTKDSFAFESDVTYWESLTERTGPTWPGLQKENRLEFSETVVIPTIKKQFKERMGF
jgi:hypothetical protein